MTLCRRLYCNQQAITAFVSQQNCVVGGTANILHEEAGIILFQLNSSLLECHAPSFHRSVRVPSASNKDSPHYDTEGKWLMIWNAPLKVDGLISEQRIAVMTQIKMGNATVSLLTLELPRF